MSNAEGTLFSDKIHTIFDLGNGVYRIDEIGIANAYLVIGESKALLIDSGNGVGDIGSVVASLTNRPVMLLLTHKHCDHAGGRFFFHEYFLDHEDKRLVNAVLSSRLASRRIINAHKEIAQALPLCKKRYHFPHGVSIGSSFTINLGNRLIKAKRVGGHTKGSIIVLDEKSHTLFAGDNVCPWLWLQLSGSECLSKWLEAAKVILSFSPAYKIYSGHNVGFTSVESLKGLIAYGEKVLAEAKYGKFDHEKNVVEIGEDPTNTYRILIRKKGLK